MYVLEHKCIRYRDSLVYEVLEHMVYYILIERAYIKPLYRHWQRIANLLGDDHGGKLVYGGLSTADEDIRFMPPTLVLEPHLNSALMTEEIFGPVLCAQKVKGPEEACDFISSR